MVFGEISGFEEETYMNYELYKHEEITDLKHLLSCCAEKYHTHTVFRYQEKTEIVEITYSQFKKDVEALGTFLLEKGHRNCKIAVLGENSYAWIVTYFAAACGKNIVVPLDKDLLVKDVAELLLHSECRVLFYSHTYSDIAEALQNTEIEGLICYNLKHLPTMITEGETLVKKGKCEYVDRKIQKQDVASIVYTSGTTGKSKGVLLTHYNLCSCARAACENVLCEGVSFLVLPLHHTYGLVTSVFSMMNYGVPIYINKSLKRLVQEFPKAKPQNIFAVPLMVEMLYKNIWNQARAQGREKSLQRLVKVSDVLLKCKIDLRKVFFKSIRLALGGELELIISGGAPLDEVYIKGFKSFGITVLNGYGITECGPVVAVNRNCFSVSGSVGMPLSCNQVRISEEGEILVKGDNVTPGYYRNEEENKKSFTKDGWFKTGDLGKIDEYGALHITGRIKNLIILSNGKNISAEAIESQIYTIPYVKEVIVYGKNDKITAEVYLDEKISDARNLLKKDIQQINRRLPQIQNIGDIIIRDTEFPKTSTKKIKR